MVKLRQIGHISLIPSGDELSVIDRRKFRFMVDEVPNFTLYIMDAMARRIRGMGNAMQLTFRQELAAKFLRLPFAARHPDREICGDCANAAAAHALAS